MTMREVISKSNLYFSFAKETCMKDIRNMALFIRDIPFVGETERDNAGGKDEVCQIASGDFHVHHGHKPFLKEDTNLHTNERFMSQM